MVLTSLAYHPNDAGRETPHNQLLLHRPIIWPSSWSTGPYHCHGTTVHALRPVSGRCAVRRIDASTPIRQTRSARSSRGRHGRCRDGPYTDFWSGAPETPEETVNIQFAQEGIEEESRLA